MRNTPNVKVERFRITEGMMASSRQDGNNGAFFIPFNGVMLTVIASDEGGWDHVSVSTQVRTPTWAEMSFIYSQFFTDDEAAMQLHPPKKAHINCHPNCLHIWRKQGIAIEMPPSLMVGPEEV